MTSARHGYVGGIDLNLYCQGTWTKTVYTKRVGPVCECIVECTLGVQFCQIHPRCQPGATNKKAPIILCLIRWLSVRADKKCTSSSF